MKISVTNQQLSKLKIQALHWAYCKFDKIVCLDTNEYNDDKYSKYEFLLAVGSKQSLKCDSKNAFEKLEKLHQDFPNAWKFGYLSYDLKNDVEQLSSENQDHIDAPALFFFIPRIVITISKNLEVFVDGNDAQSIWDSIQSQEIHFEELAGLNLQPRDTSSSYIKAVKQIKEHILNGNVYEMNFCMELFQKNIEINPLQLFNNYNRKAKAPFSSLIKVDDNYLICGSPERFLQKTGNKLISQPIKGTIKRGKTTQEDEALIEQLRNDPKEQAENVMIVDLVRNDLSRSCKPGTVAVDELFGIYPFSYVHQMISTVSGQLRGDVSTIDSIKNAFPMGSMTGAPKVKAMELIEHFENTKRGIYSGAVGYITPNGDLDFNVVIRSFVYNQSKKYLSYLVGSAITIDSQPEKEYEECLLKAEGVL